MNYYIEYLLLVFLHIHCNHVSGEYYIGSGEDPRYLYRKFDNLEEKIFPRNIRINISLSSIKGTLLYSIDRNMNQLIVSLQESPESIMTVEFRRQRTTISIADLCQCTLCKYEILDLWIQILSRIQIQCNSRIIKYIEYGGTIDVNKDHPILYSKKDSNMPAQNEAHMFLINHPKYEGIYPNSKQLSGCLFSVQYNNGTVSFTNMSNIFEGICKKTCIMSVCNGGECLETYNQSPVCNCTKTFRNGPNCNDAMLSKNFQTKNYDFSCHAIKLSWKSVNKELFKLINQYVQILVETKENNVNMSFSFINGLPIVSKAILSTTYTPNTESILIAQFKDRFVNIQFYNNGKWSSGKIAANLNFTDMMYESLIMTSGTGMMDMVFMANGDRFYWKELKNDSRMISIDVPRYSKFIPNNESFSITHSNRSIMDIQKFEKNMDCVIALLVILVILLIVVGLLIIFRIDVWNWMKPREQIVSSSGERKRLKKQGPSSESQINISIDRK